MASSPSVSIAFVRPGVPSMAIRVGGFAGCVAETMNDPAGISRSPILNAASLALT